MKRTVVMFDVDGTLIDSMPGHGLLAAKAIQNHFGSSHEEALRQYYATTGILFIRQLEIIVPDADDAIRAACRNEYESQMGEDVSLSVPLFSDVREILVQLQARGVTLVVSTSNPMDLLGQILEKHRIQDFFALIRGREFGGKPDHIKEVIEAFTPELIFFLGDSDHDVQLNRESTDGTQVITVGRAGDPPAMSSVQALKAAGADYSFRDMNALIPIIDQLTV